MHIKKINRIIDHIESEINISVDNLILKNREFCLMKIASEINIDIANEIILNKLNLLDYLEYDSNMEKFILEIRDDVDDNSIIFSNFFY